MPVTPLALDEASPPQANVIQRLSLSAGGSCIADLYGIPI